MPVGIQNVGLDDHVLVTAFGQFGEVGQAQGGDNVVLQLLGIELQQLVENRALGVVEGALERFVWIKIVCVGQVRCEK